MVKEGYKNTSIGTIPDDWEVERLSDVGDVTGGNTPRRSTDEYWGGDIPWLTPSQLTGKLINEISETDEYITEKGFENSSVKLLPPGTVIMSSRATIGETVINKVPMTTNQGFANIICDEDKVFNYYLLYLLSYITPRLEALAGGSTFLEISRTNVRSLNIPVPPLSEQKKIASILSSVDKSIEKTDEVIEEIKELKKGLMQELLTKGIGHSEFKEVRIGPKTIKIPNIWEVKSFDEISSVNQGLQISISKRSKKPGPNKLKYITVQHLNNPNDSRYIYYINEPRDSVICEKEDVLMTRTGNTGEVITDERGVFHNNFFKIDFDREILNKDYLFYYLSSKFIQHVIKTFAGTTTISDLNHGDFYSIPVLIPTKKEQKKIASILSSVDAKIKKEEEYKAKLERLKKGLMQKLLTGEIRVNTDMEV
ncbi:restriction endonuclease subunit S [Halanaerobium kushneri]|uniref:Type I restriction enzyme, S subunit n=1 Tax=Halanaerobium kushneri TaxID=56779 RepID=A0A1N6UXB2_9FIRM|nr:restriction endonuclease subunit S [Halanaerobium kushneri]SIQ70228.1 type I restriction enzyme, S subunit [Halanaerobium kushneri]